MLEIIYANSHRIHSMQSSLPTTIYEQNLSFFVSQISNCHNFFSILPIYMILWEIQKLNERL